MSDLLTAAAEALGTPAELVSRSAAARAEANGTTKEAILEAWAGGAPAAAPAKQAEPAEGPELEPEAVAEAPAGTPPPERAAPESPPIPSSIPAPAAAVAVAPPLTQEEPLDPIELPERLRTTGRIGVWTGAVLGLFAFVIAAAMWSQNVTVTGEETFSPVFVAEPGSLLIGVALVSIVFGAVVAGFARSAASWARPAMQLQSSGASTLWIGAVIGLVLGLVGGAVLSGVVGTPIEGSEEGLVQLPVLPTLFTMLIGGAILGGLTTLITQFFAVPVALGEPEEEVSAVRARLGNAIGIPAAGIILLLALVLPFAWTLIESNHLTSGGAAIIAIITSAGILGFATLAGSRPNVRIGRGELLVAVLGIGIVVLILFAVLNNLAEPHEEEGPPAEEAAIVWVTL